MGNQSLQHIIYIVTVTLLDRADKSQAQSALGARLTLALTFRLAAATCWHESVLRFKGYATRAAAKANVASWDFSGVFLHPLETRDTGSGIDLTGGSPLAACTPSS
ncbi:hypothetical protein RRG08_043609 [Elysia crispata]|uniref:Uncharacterized protein n=1 Tax=Elysia crispata TaxID=231223 RepID=A0AAE1A664_9GAST|nr:hypothetical protein RRG08_043609 [Elysia crispata]